MQILRAADHRRMPWKNGGGETLEIAVHPPEAGLGDFAWRLSMALVTVDGPFSAFAAVDRTIALLEGDGLELGVDGRARQVLTPASPPWSFAGDVPTEARLTGGPIRDLNAMTRRGRATHRVERVRLADPLPVRTGDGWVLALCTEGGVGVEDGAALSRHDVAVCGPGESMILRPDQGVATAFLVHFVLVAGGSPDR